MQPSTQRKGKGPVAVGWALVAAGAFAFAACADASPASETASQAQVAPAAMMTPAQVLGVQLALVRAANMEASVAYGVADGRIGDLTNRIANARIAQEDEAKAIATSLGVTIDEQSPLVKAIAAQSARDVAALRAADAATLADMYINGLVLTEARALGMTDHMLVPNSQQSERVAAFILRTKQEFTDQLSQAQVIQRSRTDWRFNTSAPYDDSKRGPVIP